MNGIFEANVMENSVTPGTGPLTMTPIPGFFKFSDALSVGSPCHYCIKTVDVVGRPTGDFEMGIGTYSAADTLSRTTVFASSNGGALVNFTGDTKTVIFSALPPNTPRTLQDWQQAIGIFFPGVVAFCAMTTPPAGWLKANGAAISRTSYANLFAAIGTTFGAGDGSTTFNVPDLRGYFPRAFDDGAGRDSGRVFGSTQASQNLSHNHTVTDPGHAHGVTQSPHGHGMNDPGHGHAVNDPGHNHGSTVHTSGSEATGYGMPVGGAFTNRVAINGGGDIGTNGSGTGVWVSGNTTGTYVSNSNANISINGSGTGVSVNAAGGSEARPSNLALTGIIKY